MVVLQKDVAKLIMLLQRHVAKLAMLLQRDVAKMRKETEVYRRDSRLPSFLFDDETQDLQQELSVLRSDYDKAKKVSIKGSSSVQF